MRTLPRHSGAPVRAGGVFGAYVRAVFLLHFASRKGFALDCVLAPKAHFGLSLCFSLSLSLSLESDSGCIREENIAESHPIICE